MNTRLVLGILTAAVLATPLLSQNTRRDREELERFLENQPEQRGISRPSNEPFSPAAQAFRPAELGVSRDWLYDFGGWARMTYSTFDTPFGFDSTLADYDVRLWGEVKYRNHHRVYGRLRTFFADYMDNSGRDNWQGLRVDQLFYEVQIARAMEAEPTLDLDATFGRQFFFIGKGVAMAGLLEGARVYARSGDWQIEALAARNLPHAPDIDPTLPLNDFRSKRNFFGATVSTSAYLERRFYAYGLLQIDNNDLSGTLANPAAPQTYRYDTFHLGIGGEGNIPLPGLRANELGYSAELIVQTGKGVANNSTAEETISSYAFLADIFWLPGDRLPFPSRVIFGYGVGTGDPDRQSQVGTLAGNTAGSNDSAFNYFGFVNTGLVLAPKLTNLHFFKINAEGTFLRDAATWTRELKIGATLYAFSKHHSGAGITDLTAVRNNSFIGTEFNLYADWTVASDVDVGLRYGAFIPGDAYTVSKVRQYMSLFFQVAF